MGKARYLTDELGDKVNVKYVHPSDLKRHDMVEDIFKQIGKLQTEIARAKRDVQTKIKAYLEEVAAEYGEDWKGNATLNNFNSSKQVEVKIANQLTFDERLQVAKTKIDNCIKSWGKGSSQKIIALVNRAFKVDKKGSVDAKQILSLRTLNFDDPEWKEAMEIISDAIKVESTKEFIYFRVRNDKGIWITVPLNFHQV